MDKDLRQALKSKKFSYQTQPEEVKQYIEKLRSKQKSRQRKVDRERRKQSELSHNWDGHSQRSRFLSSSTQQLGNSNHKRVEPAPQPEEEGKGKQLEPAKELRFARAIEEPTGEEQNSERTDDEVYQARHQRAEQKEKNIIVKIEL